MSKFRSSLLISGGSQYLMYILSFVKIAVISRLLTPSEIGAYTLAASLVFLAQFLRVFGTWEYIISQKEIGQEKLCVCFTIVMIAGVLITAIFTFGAAPMAEFFNAPELAILLWVMVPSFLVMPIGSVALALMNRNMDFATLSKIRVAATVVDTGVVLVMIYAGFGFVSLGWGYTLNNFAATGLIIYYAKTQLLYRPSFTGIVPILRFGAWSSLGTFLTNVGTNGPPLVLGYGMTAADVGTFGRGQALITFFRQGIEVASRPVTMAWFAQKGSDNPELVGQSYLKVTTLIAGLAWPVYISLAFATPTLIPFLLGDQWAASIPLSQILCIGGLFSFYAVTGNSVLEGQGLVHKKLHFNLVAQGARFTLLFASINYGLTAFTAALAASHFVSFVIISLFLKAQTNLRMRDVLASMIPSAVVGAVMLAAGLALFAWVLPSGQLSVLNFTLFVMVMMTTWLSMLKLSGHPLWLELVRLTGKLNRRGD